jgi:hypothetical protein
MPNLKAALSSLDPGFCRIVADFWGIEGETMEPSLLIVELQNRMTDISQFNEMLDSLPAQAKQAMEALAKNNGRTSWPEFIRRFGKISEIGQGKIEREKQYLKRNTATEILWFRGLLFRAFLEENDVPREFAFLPDEFTTILRSLSKTTTPDIFGKPFHLPSDLIQVPANDHILDHACTLLAALRSGMVIDNYCHFNIPTGYLATLLISAGILNETQQPRADAARRFLEAERSQGLLQLFTCWQKSESLNELWLMPEIKCEGKWKNQPQAARAFLLKLLSNLPAAEWWDLDSIIADIHQHEPDFLRPSGDYDSWIIRNRASGEYLRGFAHWDHVEGQYIRSIVTQWLHWLGVVDLAVSNDRKYCQAFRLTSWSKFLFNHQGIPNLSKENERVILRSNGSLFCPRLSPRSARYQTARFCEWGEEKNDGYHYYLSASALQKAEKQQLKINQLITLLKKHAKAPIPLSFLKAMTRWEQNHLQAKFEKSILLRVSNAAILDELMKGQTRRFILERVGPQLVLIKPGGEKVIQRALMEIGYLSENAINL